MKQSKPTSSLHRAIASTARLVSAASLCLALFACGEDPPSSGPAASTVGGHGSHGSHGSHGDHGTHGSHGDASGDATGSAQGPGDQTQEEFDPMVPGSAPPDPGPRDCNALVPTGIEVGDVAPNFTLLDGHGKEVRLHDYCNHVVFLISGTMSCTH